MSHSVIAEENHSIIPPVDFKDFGAFLAHFIHIQRTRIDDNKEGTQCCVYASAYGTWTVDRISDNRCVYKCITRSMIYWPITAKMWSVVNGIMPIVR